MVVEELTGLSYLHFVRDMLRGLGVEDLEDMDFTQDLQKEDIHLDEHQNNVGNNTIIAQIQAFVATLPSPHPLLKIYYLLILWILTA